jgi:hypothetical protein
MPLKKLLPFILLISVAGSGCKKSADECTGTTTASISYNSTSITIGWSLTLSAESIPLCTYVWTGPNGWKAQTNTNVMTKTNMQFTDAGNYEVKVYNYKGCLVSQGVQNIKVVGVEDAPCNASTPLNSCFSNLPNIGNFNFARVFWAPNSYTGVTTVYGYMNATGGGPYLVLTFSGGLLPKPGTYKTIFSFGDPGKEDEVSVNFYDGISTLYKSEFGQSVYVQTVNGKLQFCFCNIKFAYFTNFYITSKAAYF